MDVAVVKLGVGNTASVLYALERLVRARLTDDPNIIAEAPRLILPGVARPLRNGASKHWD